MNYTCDSRDVLLIPQLFCSFIFIHHYSGDILEPLESGEVIIVACIAVWAKKRKNGPLTA